MSGSHAAEPSSRRPSEPPFPSSPDAEDSSTPPAPHKRHEDNEWTVDEEGIVTEPSDHAGPDFNDDLDPTDAP